MNECEYKYLFVTRCVYKICVWKSENNIDAYIIFFYHTEGNNQTHNIWQYVPYLPELPTQTCRVEILIQSSL